MRQAVKVAVGIIVNIVKKLVAPFWRAVCGREEAAGYSALDDSLSLYLTQRQECALALYHLFFKVVDGAARALGIGGTNNCFFVSDRDGIALLGKALGKGYLYGVFIAVDTAHPEKLLKILCGCLDYLTEALIAG